MQQDTRQKNYLPKIFPMTFSLLLATVFLLFHALSTPLLAQECDMAKTVKEKTTLAAEAAKQATEAENEFNKLPLLPPKPANGKDSSAAKTAFDAANDKWIKVKEALNDVNRNLKQQGKDGFSLKQDIANKKQELAEKDAELKTKDTTAYSQNKSTIEATGNAIRSQMINFNRSDAREKLNDTSYKNLDPSKAADSDAVAKAGQDLLDNNVFTSENIKTLRKKLEGAVTGTKGIFQSGGKNPWDEIKEVGPQLISEIEIVQKAAKEKFRELERLDGDGIGKLEAEIQSLKTELTTLEGQLKPVTDAENKVKAAKKEYDDAEKKFNESEKGSQAITDWEAADKKRREAEKKKTETAAAKTKAETEKANAEKVDAQFNADAKKALTDAQTAAMLRTLDARLATVNKVLLKEAADEVLTNDSKVAENKKIIEQRLKAAQNEDQKKILRQRWKDYFTGKVRPHYIRKRNKAEGDRLQAIIEDATLQKFKCSGDVATFINLLGQAINDVLNRTASLASDMDSGAATGADESIPVPIPPLDEGEGKEGIETPTDEVPDDIAKGTGEVKVIQYFVFLLTNSSNGLYVGSEDSLKGRTRCSFEGGGIGCNPSDVVTYKRLLGPFATQKEAQSGLCQNITESRNFPLGVGLKGRWQGGSNWYGLWNASISGCPAR